MRQIVLDTETTGLEPSQGHRIIEIGCVEVIDRKLTGNHYHQYIKPERDIDEAAVEVHGITSEFLADKPVFAQIAEEFLAFVSGAELIIHNAPFDVGFIDAEFSKLSPKKASITKVCSILDTLAMARERHPGQKNNLDALCKRYDVENSHRDLHGALLDAEILADVYLMMTGGQTALSLSTATNNNGQANATEIKRLAANRNPLKIIYADQIELQSHQEKLAAIDKKSDGKTLWRGLE